MFPVSYELGVYIPEEGILHSHRRESVSILNAEVNYFVLRPQKNEAC
jgi:hypothetical protein